MGGGTGRVAHRRPAPVFANRVPRREHREHLLDEERVAFGGVAILPRLVRELRLTDEAFVDAPGLSSDQGLEQDRGGVEFASGPPGRTSSNSVAPTHMSRIELHGSARRCARGGRGRLRRPSGYRRRRARRSVPASASTNACTAPKPSSTPPPPSASPAIFLPGVRGYMGGCRVPRASCCPRPDRFLDDLQQRPESDALPVGKAAPARDPGPARQVAEELVHQPRLPDTGDAEHGEELAGAIAERLSNASCRRRSSRLRPTIADTRRPARAGDGNRSASTRRQASLAGSVTIASPRYPTGCLVDDDGRWARLPARDIDERRQRLARRPRLGRAVCARNHAPSADTDAKVELERPTRPAELGGQGQEGIVSVERRRAHPAPHHPRARPAARRRR